MAQALQKRIDLLTDKTGCRKCSPGLGLLLSCLPGFVIIRPGRPPRLPFLEFTYRGKFPGLTVSDGGR